MRCKPAQTATPRAQTSDSSHQCSVLPSFAGLMEGGESILDAIFEEDNLDAQDVEMFDIEEGELVEQHSKTQMGQNISENSNEVNQESCSKNRKRRNSKRKNKRKKGSSGPNTTDINRFVLDVCKRLREKKSYLVWTAVGCLGVSALSDLVKEVNAILACGGQKTADGRRFRNGGGILWNILKTREPNAFKEIMKKGKEFEKQFSRAAVQSKDTTKENPRGFTDQATDKNTSNDVVSPVQSELDQSRVDERRAPVHDRIRVPVTYDDLIGEEDQKDKST